MKYKLFTLTLGVCLSGMAQASLIDRGNGMIYDDVLDITWLQDANYANTSGYLGDSITDGNMSWSSANQWAANLTFGGYDDWRLPSVSPANGKEFEFGFNFDGNSDDGFNITRESSELSHLYYVSLGNEGAADIDSTVDATGGVSANCFDCLTNAGPFENIKDNFWVNSVNVVDPDLDTWMFSADQGFMLSFGADGTDFTSDHEIQEFKAWAVRDGDIAAAVVPIPAAVWMFGSGLLGLLGLNRKRQS
jgi:hypothetical protein